jgi:two-component system, cell cycle response regulator
MATDLPTLDSVDMACLVLGPDRVVTWANASGRRLGGRPGKVHLGGTRIEDLIHASSRSEIRRLIAQVVDQGRSEGVVRVTENGSAPARYYQMVLCRAEDHYVPDVPTSIRASSLLVQGWNVTTLIQRQQELEARALRDALTGVSSRWAFMARLEHELERSRQTGQRVALLFADVDRFKQVNDNYGHEAGDSVLAEIAARFRATLRPSDVLGRIGGDEFAVICPSTPDWAAVSSVMDRLRAIAAQPISVAGGTVQLTVSIGAAFADEVDLGISALMARADARMFGVKAAGR